MSRLLLSSQTINDLEGGLVDEVSGHDVTSHDPDTAFLHVYYVMLFVCALWFVGRLSQKLGMPALVGEIITGIVLGPNALNLVGDHGSEFLIVIGEIGLIMLVVEAGIDVDIGMLKLIGPRGLAIAILGSIVPTLMGLFMSMLMGESTKAAVAIGSCFAPTSMGIALNVLKKAKILNTPTGQLIIAAAILDDVIALIILSELNAMKHPTPLNIVLPLLVSPILILMVGYLSIRWIPRAIKKVMSKIPEQHRENSILLLLFVLTFLLIPACHFAGSSYLLGAFLSGMMFCTDHTIHHVWSAQIKRILYWMLRIFFACTIGFAIPIQEFGSTHVITRGLLYCICAFGKIITGCFARPMKTKEFLTVSFSMSAWGEFAFILATASYESDTFDKEAFSAVLLAVLLSVIISPYCLRLTLTYFEKKAQRKMNETLDKYKDTNVHPTYFAINTRARGGWGHQDKLLHLLFKLELEIIDFRSWHAPEFNYSHHQPLTKESFYVEDHDFLLPPTKHLTDNEKDRLHERVKDIRAKLRNILGDKAIINIKRWLPGVLKREDTLNKSHLLLGEHVPNTLRRASYCRREAFKQAHSIMSSVDLKWNIDTDAVSPRTPQNDPFHVENLSPTKSDPLVVENKLPPVPAPKMLQRAKSDNVNYKMPQNTLLKLRYRLSDPHLFGHSGAGHGGQAKGVGALPVHNDIINVYDHWDERQEEYRRPSQFVREQESDDEVSYLYGDEDAQHHKLPAYTHTHETRKKSYSVGDIADHTHSSIQYHGQKPLQPTIYEHEHERDPNLEENDESFATSASADIEAAQHEDDDDRHQLKQSADLDDSVLDQRDALVVNFNSIKEAGQVSNGATAAKTAEEKNKLAVTITAEHNEETTPSMENMEAQESKVSLRSASATPNPDYHE